MGRSISAFGLATFLLGLTASQASADLIINVGNVNLAPGGTGTLAITVTSTIPYTLSDFGLELQIAPIGTPTSILQFTTAQPTAPFGSTNYVFAGQSFDQDFSSPFWSIPTTNPMVTAFGGDMDDSTQGYVSLGASSSKLLATVQFAAPVGAALGDRFQVSLVNNPNFTYFDDLNGNPLTGGYSTTGGMITVAASTIPEPPSLMMIILGVSGLLWHRRANATRSYQWSDSSRST